MPRNIALMAIDNSLNIDQNNQSDNNYSSNSFVNKCFTLLNNYKDYLTVVCLKCNCKQNKSNELIIKFNTLEKEYKKLIKEKNVNELDSNSNNNEETKCNEVNSELTQFSNKDHIGDNPIDNTNTEKINETANCGEIINSRERKVSAVNINSHLISKKKFLSVATLKLELFIDSKVLYSRKSNSLNKVVGYRYKKPNNCENINRNKAGVYEHVHTKHTGHRPDKCHICEHRFASKAERKSYQSDHNDDSQTRIRQNMSETPNDKNSSDELSDIVERKRVEQLSSQNTNESLSNKKCLGQQNLVVNNRSIRIETGERPVPEYISAKVYNASLRKLNIRKT